VDPIPSPERESLILLLAPAGRDAKLVDELFHGARLQSQVCLTVEELCRDIERGAGAVFVAEEALDSLAIESLAAVLNKQGSWSDLPVVVLTVAGEPTEAAQERLTRLQSLGDLTLLERPLRTDTIVSAARAALRARAKQYQVRRRDAELQLVTDNVPVLISYIDRDQVYRRVNHTYFEWFGVRPEQVVGSTIQSTVGEPHYTQAQPYITRVLQGERVHFESQLRDKRRELRDVSVSYAPDSSSDGSVRGFVALVQDITDRKKAERALMESERQFRSLADTFPNLAWMAYADGHVFWYNQRWYDYTGSAPETLEGWGWRSVLDPEELPKVMERWNDSIRTGDLFEMVFPLRGANSMFRLFLTRIVPLRDSSGAVTRWFGTSTDIDEQKRAEEALRQANRDLEEFAYVATHDLQEPLRMVNIYSQLLLKRVGADPGSQLREYADYVRTGVKRMETLIRDLLDYSRITHGVGPPLPFRADLEAALRQALASVEARVRENQAEVTSAPLPAVAGDEAQLAHVFQNLLSNALKYRKPGETPRIHICAERQDAHWVVSVQDNGIGFDQDQAERIFGLFKRLHRHEEYPGTGLGLAICKHIVERHRGRVWAHSQAGVGSTFFVSLPVAPHE